MGFCFLAKVRLRQFKSKGWVFVEENLTGLITEKQDFADREKIGGLLRFYGMVKDNKGLELDNVIVMVFARFTGGIEKPLDYTFTDKEGRYFISIPMLPDNHDLLGYKVRAGKPQIPSKVFDCPVNCSKEQEQEPEPDTVQSSATECVTGQDNTSTEVYLSVPGQDRIADEINFSLPSENQVVELIDFSKAGESKSPEGAIFVSSDALLIEPNKAPIKKMENVYKKNEFTSTMLFLLVIGLFGIFVMDAKSYFPGQQINRT